MKNMITLLLLPVIAASAGVATVKTVARPLVEERAIMVTDLERQPSLGTPEGQDRASGQSRMIRGPIQTEPMPLPTTDRGEVAMRMPYSGSDRTAVDSTSMESDFRRTPDDRRVRGRQTSPANPRRPRVRSNTDMGSMENNDLLTQRGSSSASGEAGVYNHNGTAGINNGQSGTTYGINNGQSGTAYGMNGQNGMHYGANGQSGISGRTGYGTTEMRNLPFHGNGNTFSMNGLSESDSQFNERKDNLNNEFSRMFELRQALMQDGMERLVMKLEYEVLKEEYKSRLKGLVLEQMSGQQMHGQNGLQNRMGSRDQITRDGNMQDRQNGQSGMNHPDGMVQGGTQGGANSLRVPGGQSGLRTPGRRNDTISGTDRTMTGNTGAEVRNDTNPSNTEAADGHMSGREGAYNVNRNSNHFSGNTANYTLQSDVEENENNNAGTTNRNDNVRSY